MTDFFSVIGVLIAMGALVLGANVLNEATQDTIFRDPRRLFEVVMRTIKQRAALIICAGAALCLLDYTLFPGGYCGDYLPELHDTHMPFLLGSFAILVGVYHWIAGPPNPEI
ncbi:MULTISPECIES: hypothetical protein [unclassified Novosphingobium]|uniref:hypothetical protein n=1 Tax=unclassified Novosphingobium TaxID=2644732 RepID=UPI000D309C3A|nr:MULTISPECIES: hypothetical protein [unclassified Novosphingobium]PTR07889.1 hypothetical protein C8K11_113100 [Novosphingobium sp. GV055]PUB00702.1 hypothetical protein C8K12_113100 [Novosphingobium sp. GV061]PUB16111.1 hypothetical protein C8K14_113100 [Novosphingobium sp. GV079]PUB39576.1 hypothetical protein C8K10_113100 [Novosphingobium sp. GV027]